MRLFFLHFFFCTLHRDPPVVVVVAVVAIVLYQFAAEQNANAGDKNAGEDVASYQQQTQQTIQIQNKQGNKYDNKMILQFQVHKVVPICCCAICQKNKQEKQFLL